ncbi:hypothetical protein [Methylobacterium sp. GC_Met_2]|uniref:hypothetical protein n=1 Tax=Methylobacterium sp. GC_Met_2 TaxID=2937376 RepID=UPI00226B8701|nr:hypothetical protein [Methylobacterium sp. GC_Met_2]
MRIPIVAATTALILLGATQVRAAGMAKTQLKPFNVTIRVFDPTKGMESGQDYVLPVDSPDAEHAIASTTANAASFTRKAEGGKALPVAFTCIKVEAR